MGSTWLPRPHLDGQIHRPAHRCQHVQGRLRPGALFSVLRWMLSQHHGNIEWIGQTAEVQCLPRKPKGLAGRMFPRRRFVRSPGRGKRISRQTAGRDRDGVFGTRRDSIFCSPPRCSRSYDRSLAAGFGGSNTRSIRQPEWKDVPSGSSHRKLGKHPRSQRSFEPGSSD